MPPSLLGLPVLVRIVFIAPIPYIQDSSNQGLIRAYGNLSRQPDPNSTYRLLLGGQNEGGSRVMAKCLELLLIEARFEFGDQGFAAVFM